MSPMVWRASTAILATTLGAALIGTALILAFFAAIDPTFRDIPLGFVPLVFVGVFLFGLLFAAVPALVLGLLFELPLVVLTRGRGPIALLPHALMSAMAGACLLTVMAWVNHLLNPVGRMEGTPLVALAGAAGGLCSALAWSRFVTRL